MTAHTVEVSVVVCTKDRASRLRNAFAHFERLRSAVSWELVLVNNGSTDDTAAVLADYAAAASARALVLYEPRRGVSAGRNTGWRAASGSVLAFMDDDCYPAEDYIDQLSACFAERDLGYIGGRVLLFDHNDFPVTIQPSELRLDIAPRSFIRPGTIHGANMAFRRQVLVDVDGFDESMGPGTSVPCAEDIDLLARASAIGHAGALVPGPTVFHHHGRSSAEEVRRLMAIYDIGREAYYAKGMMDSRSRSTFLWPVMRRIGGNLCRGDFAVMRREFHGAWKYLTR